MVQKKKKDASNLRNAADNERLAKQKASASTNVSKARSLANQYERPAEKWYKGSAPTGAETLARVYNVSGGNKDRFTELEQGFKSEQQRIGSPIYNPYSDATNYKPIEALTGYGFDLSGGITPEWLEANRGLLNDKYTTNSSYNAAAPSKSRTPEQNIAGWYQDLVDAEERTQAAESEYSALAEAIAYDVSRGYSDEQILKRVRTDFDKNYKTLAKMDADRLEGGATILNRRVNYSGDDTLYGMIWAARNDGGTGDYFVDAVNYTLGRGNRYAYNPDSEAARDPANYEQYHPYAMGGTYDDYNRRFGVNGFTKDDLEANRASLLDGSEGGQKMYQKAYEAAELTEQAKTELAALQEWADKQVERGKDFADIEAQLKSMIDPSDGNPDGDYAALARMEKARKLGSYVTLSSAVDFTLPTFLAKIEAATQQRDAEKEQEPAEDGEDKGGFFSDVGNWIGNAAVDVGDWFKGAAVDVGDFFAGKHAPKTESPQVDGLNSIAYTSVFVPKETGNPEAIENMQGEAVQQKHEIGAGGGDGTGTVVEPKEWDDGFSKAYMDMAVDGGEWDQQAYMWGLNHSANPEAINAKLRDDIKALVFSEKNIDEVDPIARSWWNAHENITNAMTTDEAAKVATTGSGFLGVNMARSISTEDNINSDALTDLLKKNKAAADMGAITPETYAENLLAIGEVSDTGEASMVNQTRLASISDALDAATTKYEEAETAEIAKQQEASRDFVQKMNDGVEADQSAQVDFMQAASKVDISDAAKQDESYVASKATMSQMLTDKSAEMIADYNTRMAQSDRPDSEREYVFANSETYIQGIIDIAQDKIDGAMRMASACGMTLDEFNAAYPNLSVADAGALYESAKGEFNSRNKDLAPVFIELMGYGDVLKAATGTPQTAEAASVERVAWEDGAISAFNDSIAADVEAANNAGVSLIEYYNQDQERAQQVFDAAGFDDPEAFWKFVESDKDGKQLQDKVSQYRRKIGTLESIGRGIGSAGIGAVEAPIKNVSSVVNALKDNDLAAYARYTEYGGDGKRYLDDLMANVALIQDENVRKDWETMIKWARTQTNPFEALGGMTTTTAKREADIANLEYAQQQNVSLIAQNGDLNAYNIASSVTGSTIQMGEVMAMSALFGGADLAANVLVGIMNNDQGYDLQQEGVDPLLASFISFSSGAATGAIENLMNPELKSFAPDLRASLLRSVRNYGKKTLLSMPKETIKVMADAAARAGFDIFVAEPLQEISQDTVERIAEQIGLSTVGKADGMPFSQEYLKQEAETYINTVLTTPFLMALGGVWGGFSSRRFNRAWNTSIVDAQGKIDDSYRGAIVNEQIDQESRGLSIIMAQDELTALQQSAEYAQQVEADATTHEAEAQFAEADVAYNQAEESLTNATNAYDDVWKEISDAETVTDDMRKRRNDVETMYREALDEKQAAAQRRSEARQAADEAKAKAETARQIVQDKYDAIISKARAAAEKFVREKMFAGMSEETRAAEEAYLAETEKLTDAKAEAADLKDIIDKHDETTTTGQEARDAYGRKLSEIDEIQINVDAYKAAADYLFAQEQESAPAEESEQTEPQETEAQKRAREAQEAADADQLNARKQQEADMYAAEAAAESAQNEYDAALKDISERMKSTDPKARQQAIEDFRKITDKAANARTRADMKRDVFNNKVRAQQSLASAVDTAKGYRGSDLLEGSRYYDEATDAYNKLNQATADYRVAEAQGAFDAAVEALDPNNAESVNQYLTAMSELGAAEMARQEETVRTGEQRSAATTEELANTGNETLVNAVKNADKDALTETLNELRNSSPKAADALIRASEIAETGNNVALTIDEDTGATGAAGLTRAFSDSMELTDDQKQQFEILDALGKKYGIEFVMHNSLSNVLGAINGSYKMGSTIHIGLDAIEQGYVQAGLHEMTHWISENNKAGYEALARFVKSELEKQGQDVDALVAERINQYKRVQNLTPTRALEEIVAESCSMLLTDEENMRRFAAEAPEAFTGMRDRFIGFVDTLRNIAAKIAGKQPHGELNTLLGKDTALRKIYDNFVKVAEETSESLDFYDNFEFVSDAEAKFSIRTEEPPQETGIAGEAKTRIEGSGLEIAPNNDSVAPALSYNSYTASDYLTDTEIAAEDLAEALGVSVARAKKYIKGINSIAKMIANDRERLDYESSPDVEGGTKRSAFVSNSEYGGSIDFSTLCKKRRLLTGVFQAIQKALPNTVLSAEDVLDIRNMMIDRGLEVNCGLCYVEGSRAKMGEYAAEFIKKFQQKYPNAEWTPNMYDVTTPDGSEQMRIQHPEVYAEYEYFWNHYGNLEGVDNGGKNLFASQQKPKLYQSRTEYKGEILAKFAKQATVAAKNLNGGIRLQSFSDFETPHLLDTMQVITDMARVGLAGQAYTKVPAFADTMGRTGLKINLSLIAKGVDENGKLIFDDREGMPYSEAMRLRKKYSDNVGSILVVFNDEQFKAAMADETIDFIIPFHKSQWNKGQYDALGLPEGTKDYTNYQNEKYLKSSDSLKNFMPNSYWDFTKTGKENAEKYLQMCAEDGRRPKFYEMLVDNGDGSYSLQPDGSTDGYWKTLIDFKMYNNKGIGVPQKPVKPDFNMAQSRRIMNEYQGGADNFPVDYGVVDEFIAKKTGGGDTSLSFNTQRDTDYMAAVNSGDMETAQKMVDEAARRAGYNPTYAFWRGDAEPYNVLEAGEGGGNLGTGLYFTPDYNYAKRFAGHKLEPRKFYLNANTVDLTNADDWNAWRDFVDNYMDENLIDREYEIDPYEQSEMFDQFLAEMDKNAISARGVGGISYGASETKVNESWQAKLADPVTYDDSGNVIPLSQRFNQQNEDIRYSMNTQRDVEDDMRHVKEAEEYFGKTYRYNEAGYITLDGMMLDFSGRNQGGTGGYRVFDHRDIWDVRENGDIDGTEAMVDFMAAGNIRVSPEIGGINLQIEPNVAQYRRLGDYISHFKGEVIIDIDNANGDTIQSFEYDRGTHYSRVINDLKAYFSNGTIPQRQSGIGNFLSLNTPILDEMHERDVDAAINEISDQLINNGAKAPRIAKALADIYKEYAPAETAPAANVTGNRDGVQYKTSDGWKDHRAPTRGMTRPDGDVNNPVQILSDLTNSIRVGYNPGGAMYGNRRRLPKKVMGFYNQRARSVTTRTNVASDLATGLHEFGHAVDARLGGLTATQTMIDALPDAVKNSYGAAELNGEAIAEFVVDYMYSRDQAVAAAGDAFVEEFEKRLRTDHALDAAILRGRDQVFLWNTASVGEKIDAMISDSSKRKAHDMSNRGWFQRTLDNVEHSLFSQSNSAKLVGEKLYNEVRWSNHAKARAGLILKDRLIAPDGTRLGEGLAERFKALQADANDIALANRYGLARHALDRLDQGKPVFDESEFDRADLENLVADMETNNPKAVQVADAMVDFWREFRDAWLVGSGLATEETVAAFDTMYPHYLPTYRVTDPNFGKTDGPGATFTLRAAVEGGSSLEVVNPLHSITKMVNQVVNTVARNRVKQVFHEAMQTGDFGWLAEEVPSDMQVTKVDTSEAEEKLNDVASGILSLPVSSNVMDVLDDVADLNLAIEALQEQWRDTGRSSAANVVSGMDENGNRFFYRVKDKGLYELLSGISNAAAANRLLNGFNKVKNVLTRLTTGSNPIFALKNAERDFLQSLNTGTWGFTFADGIVKWIRAFAEVASESDLFKELQDMGGGNNTLYRTDERRDVNTLMDDLAPEKGKRAALRRAGKRFLNAITLERLNEIIENTSRFVEYRFGKHDLSTFEGRQEAFIASQDVTVDFSEHGAGNIVTLMNRVVPFANATMQGLNKDIRLVRDLIGTQSTKEQRIRAAEVLGKTVFNTGVLAALQWALVDGLFGGDDDDDEEYGLLSDEMKAGNIVFKLPKTLTDKLGFDRPWVRIPIAQGAIQRSLWAAALNITGDVTNMDEMTLDMRKTANSILWDALPSGSILSGWIDAMNNKTYYGGQIVSDYALKRSAPNQYNADTIEAFKSASRGLYTNLGIEISPAVMQYMFEQYSGIIGKILIPALSGNRYTGERSVFDSLKNVGYSIAKNYTIDPVTSTDITNNYKDAKTLLTQISYDAKNGDPVNDLPLVQSDAEMDDAIKDANNALKKGGFIYETDKQVSALWDQISEIQDSDAYSDGEKALKIRELRREMDYVEQEGLAEFADYLTQYGIKDSILKQIMSVLNPK